MILESEPRASRILDLMRSRRARNMIQVTVLRYRLGLEAPLCLNCSFGLQNMEINGSKPFPGTGI